MRRLTLSTKMLIAALPLVVALGVLLTITVRSDLADIEQAEKGAELGGVWEPLIASLGAIEFESDPANGTDASARRATDAAIDELRDAVVTLGAAEAAGDHITSSRSALSAARRNLDMGAISGGVEADVDPTAAYTRANRDLVSVGQLLPSEAGDPELGRELLAVVKLAEAKLAADRIVLGVQQWQDDPTNVAALNGAGNDFSELNAVLSEFEAIAPDEWATEFRQAGFSAALAGFQSELESTITAVEAGEDVAYDTTEFEGLIEGGVGFQTQISQSIVERAEADADATRTATWRRIAIALIAAAFAGLVAWIITRSITKRIRAVAHGANRVTTDQLPALVEALSDPRGSESLPQIEPIPARGDDELAELADSFNAMQDTLADVAQQQVEVLRRGVSDIFVTMARRNRSLIDRQLALLDEFEAEIDDPEILSNYYQLDHMATRMRRNSESLLVLANAEPKRRRVRATEVDDVVRAAIGEIEDYRRIEIEALEPLLVRGNVVADVSHLLAELLDNATSFSPPDTLVRVGGRMAGDGYMIRIVDSGVGITDDRLEEINDLLRNPPVVGLSVETTLGMSVVSLLANKRNIDVSLSPGNPGLIVDVVLPPDMFGSGDAAPDETSGALPGPNADQPLTAVPSPLAALEPGALAGLTVVEQPAATAMPDEPDEERPVAAGDWRSMSLNLAAFQSGMQSAATSDDDTATETGDEHTPVMPEQPAAVGGADDADGPTPAQPAEPAVEVSAGAIDAPAPSASIDTTDDTTGDTTIDTSLIADRDTAPSEPEETPSALEHTLTTLTGGSALPPPPAAGAPIGEFQVPPAPPLTTASQSTQPMTPADAHPAPRLRSADEPLMPSLPTRLPGEGPDGGPDRLAPAPVPTSPSRAPLPSRPRADEHLGHDTSDMPGDMPGDSSVPVLDAETDGAQLDPDALRDRLRAFQAEFRSAVDGDEPDAAAPLDSTRPTDFGGDPR